MHAQFVRNGSTSWASHVLSALISVQGHSLAWVDTHLASSLPPPKASHSAIAASQQDDDDHCCPHQGLLHLAILSQRRAMVAQVLVWGTQYEGAPSAQGSGEKRTPSSSCCWRMRWDTALTPEGYTALHLVASMPKGPTLATWLLSGALEGAVTAGEPPAGDTATATHTAPAPGPLTAHLRALWATCLLEDGVTSPDVLFAAVHGRTWSHIPPIHLPGPGLVGSVTCVTTSSHPSSTPPVVAVHPAPTPQPPHQQHNQVAAAPVDNTPAAASVGMVNAASASSSMQPPSTTPGQHTTCTLNAAIVNSWGGRMYQALFPTFPPPEEQQYIHYLGESSRPYCMVWLMIALASSSIIIYK